MALRLTIARLSALAHNLKRAGGPIAERAPFALACLSDARRLPYPEIVLRALPAGAAFILRDYEARRRGALAARLRVIARARGVLFFVGEDAALARRLGADGLHLPARAFGVRPALWRGLVTASCHDAGELALAAQAGAHAAFLSAAFATDSHPGAAPLGPARFRALAATAPLPVLALGGVTEQNAPALAGPNVAGLAAISAFDARGV